MAAARQRLSLMLCLRNVGQGKRPLGISGGRLEDNIEIDHEELWCVDWIHLDQDMDTCKQGSACSGSTIKDREFVGCLSCYHVVKKLRGV